MGVKKFQVTLEAEQRLMANGYLKFEDDVPRFSVKINEKLVEWVTDVKQWEAEHKEETKPRLGPRFCR